MLIKLVIRTMSSAARFSASLENTSSVQMRAIFCLLLAVFLAACRHPLAIEGQGDIVDLNGGDFGCSYEQHLAGAANCVDNDVAGDYFVNYAAVPREGWRFSHWEGNCGHLSEAPHCRFDVGSAFVVYWDENLSEVTVPTLTAVFVEDAPDAWPPIGEVDMTDVEVEIGYILDRMTLEEKVGQMAMAEIHAVSASQVTQYDLGAVLNGGGSWPDQNRNATIAEWVDLADQFYVASTNTADGGEGIPLLWGTDAVHGHNNVRGATIFPHNIGLGAANNPELMRQIGEVTALEVAATGIDWVFAPTLAVVRDDRWGRTYEGYSEDPEIVAELGEALVKGLQGEIGVDTVLGDDKVMVTAKHWVGDGGTSGGVDQGNTVVSETDLRNIHAQGYYTALGAGAQAVMASYNSWNGSKLHGNSYLLTEVLKEKMGFEGFVLGDWNGHGQVPGCSDGQCAQAINAGVDMIMVPFAWQSFMNTTISQVDNGTIPVSRIDDAVRRILRAKMRAGLFDKGAPSDRPNAGNAQLVGNALHRDLARQAVRESLVLLKNSNSILPLDRNLNVLVAGSSADSLPRQSGGWTVTWQGSGTSNADFPGSTSIFDGIRGVVESAGGTATLSVNGSFSGSIPDVAIVVFGEGPYAEGAGDLSDLEYQFGNKSDLNLLQTLRAQGIPVVSIFLSGRPLWVNKELNASDAFVAGWLPGSEGDGIAEVIFKDDQGEVNYDFKGKLSFSWPDTPTQFSLNRNDDVYEPLFAYGFGLSYEDIDTLGDNLSESRNGQQQSSTFEVPGKIEAENYSAMQGILLENTTDTGGGQNIGWVDAGDWMEFDIDVQTASSYLIEYRVASLDGSTGFRVEIDNVAVDFQSVPDTNGWQNWVTLSDTITLEAGEQTLRIEAIGPLWNMNWIRLTQN